MATSIEELVDPSWVPALAPLQPTLTGIGAFLREETAARRPWGPSGANILRAFSQPLDEVQVLIVGQDPYPTPGHAVGLSFSVAPDVRPLPRSLQNIFRELRDDIGVAAPTSGDLTPWTRNGIMLLNRVLTVRLGDSGSHRGIGWEEITGAAIDALVARPDAPLVAILWGRDAQSLVPQLPDVPVIASAHPSPMSADRGFVGSRPFSRANALLDELGADPVDWTLP
ncbi:MAG: uracil-DNA glycosylase [Actinobacteria bacterium]|nr:uracil-DNA glycosylase [Actinomycetota bacterium]